MSWTIPPTGDFACSQCSNKANQCYSCGFCHSWVCHKCIEIESCPAGIIASCPVCRKDRKHELSKHRGVDICPTCAYPACETLQNPCSKWDCGRKPVVRKRLGEG